MSGTRRWHTITFPAGDLVKRCREIGGITYSDLLATCALEVFIRWNRNHGSEVRPRVGLWLPVNIRKNRSSGFGNGTSRIRVYARYPDNASQVEKCREIHRQIRWSFRHGEWNIPENHPLMRLPLWMARPVLRAYLGRPRVDMGSAAFSHVPKWPGEEEPSFGKIEQIDCIGPLHKNYCVTINGVTNRDRTWLTFTYDPGLLTPVDMDLMAEMYQEQIAVAERGLICEV